MTKIVLRKPIQFGQETISELEIRDPKAKDFRCNRRWGIFWISLATWPANQSR
jgi:hypothetical protein